MTTTAKVFSTGNSQAIRLPKAFRVNVSEMWISKSEATGEITLRPVSSESSIDRLFRLIDESPLPANFLSNASRRNELPRNPFGKDKPAVSPSSKRKNAASAQRARSRRA